ncbi:low affinity immunoglobulin gamma Fc region receptor II-a-like [Scophthalmus maximus]|uniref:low affinity immunoglobulin gamma Fc region receptor II-a-like n=1 Tax=Scophthalmus maximus TaxID=52904 RepID=UPI0015E0D003|nr:low affinity immunoglobulin gamma Fc region receptor II-a-like [Scophthalmus maximus]XP_035464598.1 low affinity immunoglobulin gamma Fc region receptor II-a-like [Scophthalmus maximus]
MDVASLCLFLYLLINSFDSVQARASLTVSPNKSQFFKYDSFRVSCSEDEWRVMRRAEDGEVHACLSSCPVDVAFPDTDSGVYWCQGELGATSNHVNITVTGGLLILESPALPVTEGGDVTLYCRSKFSRNKADVHKDGVHFALTSFHGNLTIRNVSKSDEGRYTCSDPELGQSPESWLTVAAPPAGPVDPAPLSASFLLRHVIVGTPYLLTTVLLGLVYRDRRRALRAHKARQPSDDVIMEIAI